MKFGTFVDLTEKLRTRKNVLKNSHFFVEL